MKFDVKTQGKKMEVSWMLMGKFFIGYGWSRISAAALLSLSGII